LQSEKTRFGGKFVLRPLSDFGLLFTLCGEGGEIRGILDLFLQLTSVNHWSLIRGRREGRRQVTQPRGLAVAGKRDSGRNVSQILISSNFLGDLGYSLLDYKGLQEFGLDKRSFSHQRPSTREQVINLAQKISLDD
jgi:hypothetical protein